MLHVSIVSFCGEIGCGGLGVRMGYGKRYGVPRAARAFLRPSWGFSGGLFRSFWDPGPLGGLWVLCQETATRPTGGPQESPSCATNRLGALIGAHRVLAADSAALLLALRLE